MNIRKNFTKSLSLFITFTFFGFAQELPPIVKYSQNVYAAGNQNWMISQDTNHFLFFANNEGLLEFNGSSWVLYPSPNETIIRSVKVVGEVSKDAAFSLAGFQGTQESQTV